MAIGKSKDMFRIVFIVALALLCCFCQENSCESQVIYHGYLVNKMAEDTADLVIRKSNGRLGIKFKTNKCEFDFIKYKNLMLDLLYNRVISMKDVKFIIHTASNSGGIMVNGINPVILQLSLLEVLYRNNIITKTEAQAIIDNSRIKKE